MKEQIGIQKGPQNTAEAVKALTHGGDINKTIQYLKKHPEDAIDVCAQVFKSFEGGNSLAIMRLGFAVGKLAYNGVENKPKIENHTDDFSKYIDVSRSMTKEEALKKLSDFHEVDSKLILKYFPKLGDVNEKDGEYIVFETSIFEGVPCISMCVYDKNRIFKSSSYLTKNTGQPLESSH